MTSSIDINRNASCHAWSLYSFSFFAVVCSSGLVYGWPALRRNLVDEGSDLSEEALGAVFTVGAWSTQGGRFFFGMARDYCLGTRRAACLAFCCVTGGICGIAFADANNGVALAISMFFVGLGSAVQLCLQPVAGLFAKNMQGCLLASLSGAFQISGLVFLALTAISLDRTKTFGPFALALGILAIVAAMVLPKESFEPRKMETNNKKEEEHEDNDVSETYKNTDYKQNEPKVEASWDTRGDSTKIDETDMVASGNTEDANDIQKAIIDTAVTQDITQDETTDDGALSFSSNGNPDDCKSIQPQNDDKAVEQPTSLEQLKSREYVLLLIWFSILVIPLQYYVATIGFQLEEKGDDDGVYTGLFSILYASAAALSPVVGKIADVAGLGIAQGISTILVAASLCTLAGNSSLEVQIFGMTCYGIGRMMVFAVFFTNVGKRFGYVHYGTLAGLGLLLSAIVSLLQYPLIALAANGHETAVNVSCGIVLLCTLPYCVWLWKREQGERREKDTKPSVEETERENLEMDTDVVSR